MTPDVRIVSGNLEFLARFEREAAPRNCSYFESLLPYKQRLIHTRWSGEGCWIPLGDQVVACPLENATSYPAPGQLLLYPGGYSEMEIILAYGSVRFASKLGQLAGSHFLTVVQGLEKLPTLGRRTLWEGAQDVVFERMA